MIGRFMGVDPVRPNSSDQFGFNRYAYANNNPHRYTDASGNRARVMVDAPSRSITVVVPVTVNGGTSYKPAASAVAGLSQAGKDDEGKEWNGTSPASDGSLTAGSGVQCTTTT